jgi:serine/threonine protein kinase/tetratricopeptide (TPR) repeat protein
MSSTKSDDHAAGETPVLEDGGETFPRTLDTTTMVDEAPPVEQPPPASIGRYQIEETIGRGGMGVVYRALDPHLGRAVALKLLRARGRNARRLERARARLLREAQALAQLSHPNVVAVHDVGEVDDQVFIAMELVEGQTLRDLMRDHELELDRGIELFLAAGRGLAAAHRAGLIHRDFKPSNVVIGDDGRARVLDFGLARLSADTSDDESPSDDDSERAPAASPQHRLLATRLTQHGVTLGTPAYMAPEQDREGRSDERSDQYSFCVALFEALTGELPRSDDPPERRAEALTAAKAPRWLRSIVMRGLSARSADRYPSMDLLLRDLSHDVRARRRTVLLASFIGALAAVAIWAIVSRPETDPAARCRSGDELAGVWDEASRTRVREAFVATERPHAEDTFDRVAGYLDGYAKRWRAQHQTTCEQHYVHGAVSAHLLDLRMACLARRRSALEATARVFAGEIDDTVLSEAMRAVTGLPRLAGCTDDEALQAAHPPPDDPDVRSRVEALERELDEGDVLLGAGRATRGRDLAQRVVAASRPLEYAPLTARGLVLLGNLQLELGDYSSADATLTEAVLTAASARANEREARAWILRMRSLLLQARFDDAASLREPVEVAIARTGRSPELRADFAYTLAWMFAMKDDGAADAHVHAEESLALWIQAVGPKDPHVALAHIMLGNTSMLTEDVKGAVAHQERAIEILTESLGPTHPDVASAAHNLGIALLDLGEHDRALHFAGRERTINTEAFGADHQRTAAALRLLARIHHARGDSAQALPLAGRAVQILESAADANPSERAYSLLILADVTAAQGKPAEAKPLYEKAIRQLTEVYGPDDSMVTEAREALAEVTSAL